MREVLFYGAFILVLALPLIILTLVIRLAIRGGWLAATGLNEGRHAFVVLGLLLLAIGTFVLMSVRTWAKTPPDETVAEFSPHRLTYQYFAWFKTYRVARIGLANGNGTGWKLSDMPKRAAPPAAARTTRPAANEGEGDAEDQLSDGPEEAPDENADF